MNIIFTLFFVNTSKTSSVIHSLSIENITITLFLSFQEIHKFPNYSLPVCSNFNARIQLEFIKKITPP